MSALARPPESDRGGARPYDSFLEPGVGDPGGSGSLDGPSAAFGVVFVGVLGPETERGEDSRAFISRAEA